MQHLSIAEAAKILGVEKNVSQKDLAKRWRQLALENHPDLHPENIETFKKMAFAYETMAGLQQGTRQAMEFESDLMDDIFKNAMRYMNEEIKKIVQDELNNILRDEK